jgi:hypothetical protein
MSGLCATDVTGPPYAVADDRASERAGPGANQRALASVSGLMTDDRAQSGSDGAPDAGA